METYVLVPEYQYSKLNVSGNNFDSHLNKTLEKPYASSWQKAQAISNMVNSYIMKHPSQNRYLEHVPPDYRSIEQQKLNQVVTTQQQPSETMEEPVSLNSEDYYPAAQMPVTHRERAKAPKYNPYSTQHRRKRIQMTEAQDLNPDRQGVSYMTDEEQTPEPKEVITNVQEVQQTPQQLQEPVEVNKVSKRKQLPKSWRKHFESTHNIKYKEKPKPAVEQEEEKLTDDESTPIQKKTPKQALQEFRYNLRRRERIKAPKHLSLPDHEDVIRASKRTHKLLPELPMSRKEPEDEEEPGKSKKFAGGWIKY